MHYGIGMFVTKQIENNIEVNNVSLDKTNAPTRYLLPSRNALLYRPNRCQAFRLQFNVTTASRQVIDN